MFSKLNSSGKDKIDFFDSILFYLATNYSKEVSVENIMSNIKYTDSNIKKLSVIDAFFEEDNIKATYEKSLKLLSDSGYISINSDKYTLTVNGLVVTTSGGLIDKEKREIRRYNFQNWFWVIMVLNIISTFLIAHFFSSKSSATFCNCSQSTNHKQKDTDTIYLQQKELQRK